ncbi:DUF3147 family protein [Leptospira meyeri]|uniref:DUF3147 family protein n=1 Tax=Leptospira meyeri TaxID=29508 RepID=UPI001083057B|nr:DUF3147 family protein [Leptospira meyeri]TGL15461.1 DUF3147 family protein [Leptospira meyeri]
MFYIFLKYLLTAALVVFISEVAKRNDKLGSFIASLPLVTILTLIWLKIEKVSTEKISNHAYYTFWFVLPTLPMFLIFPKLYQIFGFWMALIVSMILTFFMFYFFQLILSRFGIHLFD